MGRKTEYPSVPRRTDEGYTDDDLRAELDRFYRETWVMRDQPNGPRT